MVGVLQHFIVQSAKGTSTEVVIIMTINYKFMSVSKETIEEVRAVRLAQEAKRKDNEALKDHLEKIGEKFDEKFTYVDSEFFPDKPIASKYSLKDVKRLLLSTNKETLRIVREMAEGMKSDLGQVIQDSEGTVVPTKEELDIEHGKNTALEDIIKALEV